MTRKTKHRHLHKWIFWRWCDGPSLAYSKSYVQEVSESGLLGLADGERHTRYPTWVAYMDIQIYDPEELAKIRAIKAGLQPPDPGTEVSA